MAAAPFRFVSEQSIRWVDVDVAGVVNHAVWFSLVEQARFDYVLRLGVASGDVPPFLLAETTARYVRPGRVGMKLVVLVKTTRLGNKSFDMEYELHEGTATTPRDGETLLARIRATLVWVDAQLASVPIPAAPRRLLAEFEGIPERG
jgi:acyl-CoA thioester hydrolase